MPELEQHVDEAHLRMSQLEERADEAQERVDEGHPRVPRLKMIALLSLTSVRRGEGPHCFSSRQRYSAMLAGVACHRFELDE